MAAYIQDVLGVTRQDTPMRVPRMRSSGRLWNALDPSCDALSFSGCDGIVLGGQDPFRETGSLLERFHILTETQGNVALNIAGAGNNARPGKSRFTDITIAPASALGFLGSQLGWGTGLKIDGSMFQTVNASGIREMIFDHLRVVATVDYAVLVDTATHLWLIKLQVEQLGTTVRQKVLIKNSKAVFITDADIYGDLIIENCDVVNVSGFVSGLSIDAKSRNVSVSAQVREYLTIEHGATGMFNGWLGNAKFTYANKPFLGKSTFLMK